MTGDDGEKTVVAASSASASRRRMAVLGDGGWGTAIALTLVDAGHEVVLWGIDPAYLAEMERTRENVRFLPGRRLPESLRFSPDLPGAVASADMVFVGIPTQFLRATLGGRPLPDGSDVPPVVMLVKGIEHGTLERPSEIVGEVWRPRRLAVLAGPSHAEEVSRRLPATLVAASADPALAGEVQACCSTRMFRIYTSADVIGVEICGALKNVLAIAAGICQGLELGDNAMAALITRGLAEMRRLGIKMGAQSETFAGLAGVGDAITTCCSLHGRNRAVGLEIGRGRKLEDILAGKQTVAEGVATSRSARDLARKMGVTMPITEQVCAVLFEGKDAREGVVELMTRDFVSEADA